MSAETLTFPDGSVAERDEQSEAWRVRRGADPEPWRLTPFLPEFKRPLCQAAIVARGRDPEDPAYA